MKRRRSVDVMTTEIEPTAFVLESAFKVFGGASWRIKPTNTVVADGRAVRQSSAP